MTPVETDICIIGAGPAGLLLSYILGQHGIRSIVIERRTRETIEGAVKAGVLEHPTIELFNRLGLGDRMMRDGVRHNGFELAFGGERHRIDLCNLTGGKFIMLYPQHEVIKDLIAAVLGQGTTIVFGANHVALHGIEGSAPSVTYTADGVQYAATCDFIAGCDGFHGPSRQAIRERARVEFTKTYACGWFGILCEAPPSSDELIYANSERGFALISTRTPTVQRMYFQCDPKDETAHWSDRRIWDELQSRVSTGTGWALKEGTVIQKDVVAMRSFVCETMQHGRLFLAGDAAHIVPPTGAKGLNLAVGDSLALSHALLAHYTREDTGVLDRYSKTALRRVWQCEQFSAWMTELLHNFDGENPIERRFRRAKLDQIIRSPAAATALAENYVGVPFAAADF